MILLEINVVRIAVDPLEGDPPRTIDRDRDADRLRPQGMRLPAGDVEVFHALCLMETGEPDADALDEIGAYSSGITPIEQVPQSLVSEAPDHPSYM
jgi:hypothetical protein